MDRRVLRHIAFAACAVFAPSLGLAAEHPLEDATRAAEQHMFADSGARGMVIAIVDGNSVSIDGYGETRPGSKTLPDAHALVRIGSLSKLLAADLMVKLAGEGDLRLTDPLQRYAPNDDRVPSSSRPITLIDLATHTSGLPRQANIPSKGRTSYTQARWEWLQEQNKLPAPGHIALYSNLGFDLLADALGNAAHMPYDQALQHYITQSLGMHDTTDAPSADQCARLMDGSNAHVSCASQSDNAGSGGMYSSAADMAAWMQQQLGVGGSGTDPQMAISQAIYFQRQSLIDVQGMDNGGHADGIGMGWVLLSANGQSPAILEKTGGFGGFMSYMALVPGRHVGVFIAVTRMDLPMLQTLAKQVNALASTLAKVDARHSASDHPM
ncbi:D-alanyl-D-alanine-carboxypeptidase/endopeptidase AmpH [Dyella caseinilytica]|uniref:D-alanyl-D-alanine-carboxypeptidase/endopeptidase AmpH n=1 Tax=Dyella caseinilytica TaxID=1849581 RepID=A0ABX7GPZ6_9GAMM|nr:D-alanyl-D-alanine-carboxypeptidase/endopeptidase AmpH [Dyella caseinilytica]QRN52138.1 D-alanyl-D-alanine-carboxypeptidase/endopeptidase AmpH [Dyella caseinilytica]GGA13644.1 D-alanyl-D-alanine-carboxypeptidase/ endopeptidase AmpH [Dyella caseinilytica]